MRISDCSSDVCSSDLGLEEAGPVLLGILAVHQEGIAADVGDIGRRHAHIAPIHPVRQGGIESLFGGLVEERQQGALVVVVVIRLLLEVGQRSEEHTSELQSLMRISYAVFCLKKKTNKKRGRQRSK